MRWMFPEYVMKNKINLTHLADSCSNDINMSPKWVRQKFSKWNNSEEVPIEENFIKTIAAVSKAMNVPVRSLLALDDDQNVYMELSMYQLGLTVVDVMRIN